MTGQLKSRLQRYSEPARKWSKNLTPFRFPGAGLILLKQANRIDRRRTIIKLHLSLSLWQFGLQRTVKIPRLERPLTRLTNETQRADSPRPIFSLLGRRVLQNPTEKPAVPGHTYRWRAGIAAAGAVYDRASAVLQNRFRTVVTTHSGKTGVFRHSRNGFRNAAARLGQKAFIVCSPLQKAKLPKIVISVRTLRPGHKPVQALVNFRMSTPASIIRNHTTIAASRPIAGGHRGAETRYQPAPTELLKRRVRPIAGGEFSATNASVPRTLGLPHASQVDVTTRWETVEKQINERIVQQVERSVREQVERTVRKDSVLAQRLSSQIQSDLYRGIVVERERLGLR